MKQPRRLCSRGVNHAPQLYKTVSVHATSPTKLCTNARQTNLSQYWRPLVPLHLEKHLKTWGNEKYDLRFIESKCHSTFSVSSLQAKAGIAPLSRHMNINWLKFLYTRAKDVLAFIPESTFLWKFVNPHVAHCLTPNEYQCRNNVLKIFFFPRTTTK